MGRIDIIQVHSSQTITTKANFISYKYFNLRSYASFSSLEAVIEGLNAPFHITLLITPANIFTQLAFAKRVMLHASFHIKYLKPKMKLIGSLMITKLSWLNCIKNKGKRTWEITI